MSKKNKRQIKWQRREREIRINRELKIQRINKFSKYFGQSGHCEINMGRIFGR